MTDSLSTLRHLIFPIGAEPVRTTEIYRCPEGNLWELIEAAPSWKLVRYTPNPASGREPSLVTVEEFLAVNSSGPEHAALRILLATPA